MSDLSALKRLLRELTSAKKDFDKATICNQIITLFQEVRDEDYATLTALRSRIARLIEAGDRMERVTVACFSTPDRDGVKFECQVCENGFYDTESEIVHDDDCPVTLWEKAKED